MAQLPIGSGASDTLFEHSRPNKPNSSRFDLSRIVNLTAEPGAIIPVDVIPCLPGDRHNLSFRYVMDTLPLVNASLTQYKVTTHWYFIKYRDLWKGWQTFSTKGRSGNVNLTIPRVDLEFGFHNNHTLESIDYYYDEENDSMKYMNGKILPIGFHSLSSYLGCPSPYSGDIAFSSDDLSARPYRAKEYFPFTRYPLDEADFTPAQLRYAQEMLKTGYNGYRYPSALDFMAYQNIVRNNYVNQNLLQDSLALFPVQGDDDWILPYDATITNFVGKSNNNNATYDNCSPSGVYKSSDTAVRLDCLRYAQFDDDYFTTGLPWLQRGEVSKIALDNVDLSGITASTLVSLNDSFISTAGLDSSSTYPDLTNLSVVQGDVKKSSDNSNYTGRLGFYADILNDKISSSTTVSGSASANFALTANQLRELIAMSVWQERNARVNGSYNAMIYQHWQVNPHSDEHKPIYIGGTSDFVTFSTILQSSQSTDDSPLGSTAGRGTSSGNGSIGSFYCEDYGLIMGLMIIKPNSTYSQGIEHHLACENVFDDFPQPEFEGLAPQPILNKEIYVSGNESIDNGLFAYQERYVYYKTRQNVNRGMFLSAPDKDSLFATFTQSRWFSSKPSFSYQFLCMSPDNLRRDFLAYPNLPTFKFQCETQDYCVRELAYTSEPNTFGF